MHCIGSLVHWFIGASRRAAAADAALRATVSNSHVTHNQVYYSSRINKEKKEGKGEAVTMTSGGAVKKILRIPAKYAVPIVAGAIVAFNMWMWRLRYSAEERKTMARPKYLQAFLVTAIASFLFYVCVTGRQKKGGGDDGSSTMMSMGRRASLSGGSGGAAAAAGAGQSVGAISGATIQQVMMSYIDTSEPGF